MPTPYGSRGGMAFSADELRVLRGALANALQPTPLTVPCSPYAPVRAAEVREFLDLAEALDETAREGRRLRSFLLADLARYREALPGSASGYLEQLEDALAAGYLPRPDDLAALRALCAGPAAPVGEAEAARRTALLRRCERLADRAVRARLLVLPGGRSAADDAGPDTDDSDGDSDGDGNGDEGDTDDGDENVDGDEGESDTEPVPPVKRPPPAPGPVPTPDPAPDPEPSRPVPTPAEVFPPRRRPAEPPQEALPA